MDSQAPVPPAPRAGPFAELLGADGDLRVSLPVFEGPLDLLLFLIRRNEIDIYDIPIESVTRQYLQILRAMDRMRLEVAGDFFVMAATLMEIKSRMLLPRDLQVVGPEEEEGADPRWELVHQLLQYRRFKEAAGTIDGLIREAQDLLVRPPPGDAPTDDDRPLARIDRIDLWGVFNAVLRRLSDRLVVGEIHDEAVTIVDRMEHVLVRLREGRPFTFTSLFVEATTLYAVVVTFLAVLELARLGRLRVRQAEAFDDLEIAAREAAAV